MFGLAELKKKTEIREGAVGCPVIRCKTQVKKMTKGTPQSLDAYLEKGRRKRGKFDQYLCKEHKIYITPTTFIYKNLKDSLLWYDVDEYLVNRIMEVKRVKAQLYHDNSEDVVAWNVFRFLERSELLSGFLSKLHSSPVTNPEIIYWSYSQSQRQAWNELESARGAFGESQQRSSEPDIIIRSDDSLFLVEVKLKARNKVDFNRTHTPKGKEDRIRRYSKGDCFLKQPVEDIIDAGYYQLMRFWLIGAWIAENQNLNFYLLNLVRENDETHIEMEFGKYIRQNEKRKFVRLAWEDIYEYISTTDLFSEDKDKILGYFENKTIGYYRNELRKAFSIP